MFFFFCMLFFPFWVSCFFCVVLCIVSPHVHSRLFSIRVQVHEPLPLGGNPKRSPQISYHKKSSLKVRDRLSWTQGHGMTLTLLSILNNHCQWFQSFRSSHHHYLIIH
jgi:hypothetical protein